MPSGVSGYAAIHAQVRIKYSALLNSQDYARLNEAPDFNSLVTALKSTAYGPYLENLKDKDLTPRRAVFQIKTKLADSLQSVINMAPGHARPILLQLYRFYEMDNLKAVLRGLIAGSGSSREAMWDRVRHLLFPYGSKSVIPAQAMLEAGNVASAIELLKGTPYYETLSFAMKRYNAEQSIFPFEVTLDLSYWRKLWQEAQKLPGQDREQAVRVIGSLVDMNNLMWAIRYRVYHNLSEEELINYTLPFGYHVRDEDIRAVAAGADIAAVVNKVYAGIPEINSILEEPRSGLPRLELELKRHVLKKCMAAFVGNPFQIGIPLAYMILSELEVQDLTVLIEAKSTQVPDEEYRPYLVRAGMPQN